MAEHGHSNYPAELLQTICCDVQNEQVVYPLMQQGVYPGASDPCVSRGVASAPEVPFSKAMDELPFASPPMFRGVCPFSFVFCSTTFASFVVCTPCAQRMLKSLHCVCLSEYWAPYHQAVMTLYTSCSQLAVSSQQMHSSKQCDELSNICVPVLQGHLRSPLHLHAQPPHPCLSVNSQCPLKISLIGTSLSHCFSMRRSC